MILCPTCICLAPCATSCGNQCMCICVHSTRYGKYHHEMRWWHQAHFGLWQRPELLQRSDGWYVEMLPNATAYATNQGYKGARWPKMVGPETTLRCNPHSGGAFNAPSVGQTDYSNSTFPLLYHTGPSGTGPMLIWQQPHIIWMSEQQVRTVIRHSPQQHEHRDLSVHWGGFDSVHVNLNVEICCCVPCSGSTPQAQLPPRPSFDECLRLWKRPPTLWHRIHLCHQHEGSNRMY